MKTIIKICIFLSLLMLISSCTYAQGLDSIPNHKKHSIENINSYVDFQFLNHEEPLIATQVWGYSNNIYCEIRYNYENRQTASFYLGRSFKIGSKKQIEAIPMLGGYFGKSSGISIASTTILEAGWIRGFSQSQYSIDSKNRLNNFFFNWSSLSFKAYKSIYIGSSLQYYYSNTYNQLYFGTMQGLKTKKVILELFQYNFWQDNYLIAVGFQINF